MTAKKKIIHAVNPKLRLDGKGSAYINAAFDIAEGTIIARKDVAYQRKQMASGKRRADSSSSVTTSAEKARLKMISNMKGDNK